MLGKKTEKQVDMRVVPVSAFWRLILCLSIVYELTMVFLLFQVCSNFWLSNKKIIGIGLAVGYVLWTCPLTDTHLYAKYINTCTHTHLLYMVYLSWFCSIFCFIDFGMQFVVFVYGGACSVGHLPQSHDLDLGFTPWAETRSLNYWLSVRMVS